MIEEKQIEEMFNLIVDGVIDGEDNHGVPTGKTCFDIAESLYNAGYRKRSGWISADNPPKTYRDEYGELIPFLVCCRGTVHPFRAMYDGKNWGDGIGRLNVTHWMNLPEPPKGD